MTVSGASGHHNDTNPLQFVAPADPAAITRPEMDHPSPGPPPGNMGVVAGVGVPLPASAPPKCTYCGQVIDGEITNAAYIEDDGKFLELVWCNAAHSGAWQDRIRSVWGTEGWVFCMRAECCADTNQRYVIHSSEYHA